MHGYWSFDIAIPDPDRPPPALLRLLIVFCSVEKPEENGENLYKLSLSVPAGLETETVTWQVTPLPGQTTGYYASYTIRSLPASQWILP